MIWKSYTTQVGCLFDQPEKALPWFVQVGTTLHHVAHAPAKDTFTNPIPLRSAIPFTGFVPAVVVADEATGVLTPQLILRSCLSIGEPFRIAMVAGWRNVHTAPPWIEGVVRPFYF
jgi:hypothetical protein